ncbi:MAG: DUF1080 domain-containing protein [Acidobacteria bacterium]|nr:DUF1080 domain-containing protein [Acidobacteriota bacterium]
MLSRLRPARFVALSLFCVLPLAAQGIAIDQGQVATDFQPLFDGKTLDGWLVQPRPQATGQWVVEDGALKPEGKPGALATARSFGDFELVVEWKTAPDGNSGIYYRVPPSAQSATGVAIEYQLADNARKASQEFPDRRNGAAYGLYPPTEDASKPVGEWNESRILAQGNHVEHWLNGVKVVEFEIGSDDFKQRVAASKFENPAFGLAVRGRIVLQDHGQAVWFRSVKLRQLGQKRVTIPAWDRTPVTQ